MKCDKPVIKAPKSTSLGRCILFAIIMALMAGLLTAQTRIAQSDAIPMDLLDRWYQVSAGEFSGQMASWIEEGQQLLRQIHDLETLKNRALAEAPETIAEIESLRNRFVSLLKTVERARIAQMSPSELQNMRQDYFLERERELLVLDDQRKALISRAEAFRLTIDTNEFLLRHPQRAQVLEDFLFRLGELYYQDAGAELVKAFDQWNQEAEEARAKGEPIPVAPKPDYSRAEEVYASILEEYPHGKYVDACLFNLAKIYESQDDTESKEKAVDYYHRMVRSFPKSLYVSMAYLGIGDYFFFQENVQPEVLDLNMNQAIESYRAILNTPDTLLYNDAYFKIAWSYYRINRFADAVDAFTRCLETTISLKNRIDQSEYSSFCQNSIRYLALLFTSKDWGEGGLQNAAIFVQENPQRRDTYGEAVIRQMGEIQAKLYEWVSAITTYDLYLSIYPLHRNAVNVHEQKIIAMEQAGLRAAEERDVFLALYGPGSPWRNANPDPVIGAEVDSKREMFLFKSTDEVTTRAVQNANPQALEEAITFCHRFLDSFPASQRARQVRMNLAMMLYNPPMARYWDAYQQFMFLCWQYPEDTEFRETAAKNAVASAFAMIEAEKAGTWSFSPDQRTQIIQNIVVHTDFDSLYPNWHTSLMTSEALYCEALDTYLSIFPNGDFASEALWRVGKLLFDNQQYAMSRYWLAQVEQRFADRAAEVQEANKLILNGYILEKDFAGIESHSRHILQLNIDDEFRESVRIRMAEAIFQSADALREKAKQSGVGADHQASGLEFKRVALEIPDFQYADAALFNAALEFAECQDYEAAINTYQLLEDNYPKSEFLDRALYNHAYILGANLGRSEEAAEVNMRLFNNFPNSPLRSDALYNASQSYAKAGNTAKAIQVNQTFAVTYPGSAEAPSLLLNAAMMLGQTDNQEGASQMYAEFAKKYPDDPNAVRAHHERGTYLVERSDNQGARKEFQQAVDAFKQLSSRNVEGIQDVRPLASKSLYTILKWDFQNYEEVKLEPRSRLSAQIAEKKRLSESLIKGYDQLITWSEAEAIEAMVQRAEVLEEYASTYRNQAPPTDKDPTVRGEKMLQIAKDAVGYQVLAIEEYAKASRELPDARSGLVARRQTVTPEEQRALDTLIVSITLKENYCRSKYLDLRLSNADNLKNTFNELLNLPGFSNYGKQSRLKRQFTFWNTELLSATTQILGLYSLAAQQADSLTGIGNEWGRKAKEGSISTVREFLVYGQNLTREALNGYREAVGDYGNVLPKGDQAKYKGLEASDFAALADDYNKKANIYSQATVRIGTDLIGQLKEYGFQKNQTAPIEDLITAFVLEYSLLCEEHVKDAEKGLTASHVGFIEQQTVVYEDAVFVFEQWILVWSQYQLEILKMGHQFVEKFSIVSADAAQILEKLAALEPNNYGRVTPESPER